VGASPKEREELKSGIVRQIMGRKLFSFHGRTALKRKARPIRGGGKGERGI